MPRPALAVALLALLTSPSCAGAVDRDAEAEQATSLELLQARQQIAAERYAAALALLEAARARTPENADVHGLLGFASRKLDELGAAHLHYQTALRLDPDHRGAREYLGELHLQRGRPELARAQLAELERLCPQGCEERAELAEAIAAFEAAGR